MGYTTYFDGAVTVSPPLNPEEVAFLQKFNATRRMDRRNGPYYVDGGGFAGQDREADITDYNRPPPGQPGLWCQWRPSDDGESIAWDDGEKFYDAVKWMTYLIDHFLRPGAKAALELPFLQANHTVNGVIFAQGEDDGDRWTLTVADNKVTRS